jgi:hypothetical protein
MSERPLSSRQYNSESWVPYTIKVDGYPLACNLNPDPERGVDATLCVIPTQALKVVEDPARMKVKPNVMSEWLDRLAAAGASILLVHGRWFDDLSELAEQVRSGQDWFSGMERRIAGAISESLRRGYVLPGKVVVMGSSRHGFAILHAAANNPDVSAAVAHQPIVSWPRMVEFAGMDDDPIVERHSLYNQVDEFLPRPIMIQTGYADERVGQDRLEALIEPMARAYSGRGIGDRFFHEKMDIPGHDGMRIPDSALDSVVPWLQGQGML